MHFENAPEQLKTYKMGRASLVVQWLNEAQQSQKSMNKA